MATKYKVAVYNDATPITGLPELAGGAELSPSTPFTDYMGPLIDHATISDSTIKTIPTINVAIPIVFDTNDDILGIIHDIVGTECTIDIATPALIHLNSHGFHYADIVQFSTTIALPTGLTANTKYFVMSTGLTANAFQISATPRGAAINTSGSQSGVQKVRNAAKIRVVKAGDYFVSISAVFDTTSDTVATINLWVRKGNGIGASANIPNTNTQITLDTANSAMVLAVPFIFDLLVDDYIEIWYKANQTNARFLAVAASGTTPDDMPVCPSVILTMNYLSA
jgi:hypothetical protein